MDAMEAITTRRSVRSYKTDPISEDTLRKILEAGMDAPSAVNHQPWYFVAVRSPEAMEKLTAVMRRISLSMEPGLKALFPTHPEVAKDTCGFVENLGGAPACLLVFKNENKYAACMNDVYQSIAAAIENVIIAAWAEGIGSCWMTAPVNHGFAPEIEAEFAPDRGGLVAAVALGYPSRMPKAPRRKENRFKII